MIQMRSFVKTFHHNIGISFILTEIADVSNSKDSAIEVTKKVAILTTIFNRDCGP